MDSIGFSIRNYLEDCENAIVAFSGGADSTVLLNTVAETMGDAYEGVFVDSPLVSQRQRSLALQIAERLDLKITIRRIGWNELEGVAVNGDDRCYICKKAIFKAVRLAANGGDKTYFMDGENFDDMNSLRPGRKAAREMDIRSPFAELEIGRDEVLKALSHLDVPDIVKDTCMATRISTGTPLTDELLRLAESAESSVRNISGVRQVRVRLNGRTAMVLTAPEEIPKLREKWDNVEKSLALKGLDAKLSDQGYIG